MRRAASFTYLTILFVVAFMGVGMAYVGEVWHTAAVREREAELLFVGNQYRKAIERYYRSGPAQYPRALADLLKDPRKPGVERYLRQAYLDPMTGKNEWGIVKAPDGGVMGIYSLSEGKPMKRSNFRLLDKDLEGAGRYADWKFVYLPLGPNAPQPGGKPAPGATPAPVTTQSVPGAAMPGGTLTPTPSVPAAAPTPLLTPIQPAPVEAPQQ